MNVCISEEARRFVEAEVASGRYTSEDAVIEDALRRIARARVAAAGIRLHTQK